MKKSFKTSVSKVLTTAACAALMFAGALGFNSITAKAETRNMTVDLRNGRVIQYDQRTLSNIDDPSKMPTEIKDFFATAFTAVVYDPNFTKSSNKNNATSVLSTNPYQGVVLEQSDKYTIKLSALQGSVGTGKYVINKNTIMQNPSLYNSEDSARVILLLMDEATGGNMYDTYNFNDPSSLAALDALEFNIEIKYSDVPVVTNNKVNGAPSVSFEVGREFENNGINYRIIDAAGNLSAISLASASKSVTIPESVNLSGYTLNVTDSAQNFMKGNKKTKKVTVGANVTFLSF